MTCETFRNQFRPQTDDASLLAHLRSCDPCLDAAAAIDPDVMFRAIGGSEMVPPGGVDAFVDDVMRQVRVRGTETRLSPPQALSWPRRLAIAATLAAGVTGAALFHYATTTVPSVPVAGVATRPVAPAVSPSMIRPVVESYESSSATIVEVPAEGAGDVRIVMIFDENLPVDL